MSVIIVKGRRIDQNKLREFLKSKDIDDECQTEDGHWRSPITGEIFETRNQLNGHIGAYLRKRNRKDPTEPTRAGYVRALRAGLTPTEEQRAAHAEYARNSRERARDGDQPKQEPVKLVTYDMSM